MTVFTESASGPYLMAELGGLSRYRDVLADREIRIRFSTEARASTPAQGHTRPPSKRVEIKLFHVLN
jgi:hypothetical protein